MIGNVNEVSKMLEKATLKFGRSSRGTITKAQLWVSYNMPEACTRVIAFDKELSVNFGAIGASG